MNTTGIDFKFGLRLAIGLFVMASIILYLFYLSMSTRLAMLAFQFTMIAIVVNWIYAGFLLYKFLKRRLMLKELLKTLGVMMINIPIGIFYAFLMKVLLDYARVDFKNETGGSLKSLQLTGCVIQEIPDLDKGETTTAWIKLKKNCTVILKYSVHETLYQDTVLVNLSPGNGIAISHAIRN